jgi:ectoine hydroxylase-related dioxygenase (phytanoyl-CoA dioxygenase family)
MYPIDSHVDEADIDDFWGIGAVCLRKVITDDWLDVLAAGIDRNEVDRSEWGSEYTPADAKGRFWDDYCSWDRIAEYRNFLFDSGIAAIAGRLLKTTSVRLFHEHVLVKEPGTTEITPWHHDQPYYCVNGNQLLSTWISLDEAPAGTSPVFAAGTHNGPLHVPRRFVDHEEYDYGDEYEPVPDIDAEPDRYELVSWDVAPGDVIAFHMRTLHAAGGTEGLTTRRRAFSGRWLGDDAVFATRPTTTSPPFPGLAEQLSPGDPMDHPLFPIVWVRGS